MVGVSIVSGAELSLLDGAWNQKAEKQLSEFYDTEVIEGSGEQQPVRTADEK